tara:strand:- start:1734 stop:2444 length:711 start_codon:yes stop_codon:yes gene_type:complete
LKFIKDTKITVGMAMAIIMQASGVIWYIAQLDSNLTSLQTTIQVQAGQINTLNSQMSQLSKDFNLSLNSEIDKLQEDQSYTKEKMSSIETKVSSLTDNGIKDDISFVKERVAYLEATSNDVIELENKLSTVKDDINNISNLMINIENTLNDIEPNDYKYELDNLEHELKTDISNLDYSMDSLETKLNEIERSILNLERNNDFVYTTMVSQTELNQLKDEISLLKERVTWLEATPNY